MDVSPDHLLSKLRQIPVYPDIQTWWLAYSGGLDSQVLLHLLSQLPLNLKAVYVDHGLQAESAQWAQHCQQCCDSLKVPFQQIHVDARAGRRESPEAAARKARYAALQSLMQPGDCLLTAHHQDDQAETLLLQLFRGAGVKGVAAMPFFKTWGPVYHARPLLEVGRASLHAYARQHQLKWVEDPSNLQLHYDRNFIRHQLMPLLQQRWPAIQSSLQRYAAHQGESEQLLQQLAQMDLASLEHSHEFLSISSLAQLDALRQKNLLRYWLSSNACPLPSSAILDEMLKQLVHGSEDSRAQVSWAGMQARTFQGRLYVLPCREHDASQCLAWDGLQALCIDSLNQSLQMESRAGGLRQDILSQLL